MGLITTVYYMDPTDAQWANHPAVLEWKAFMAKYYPEGNLADGSNMYGYAVAQTMHQVLKQAGNNLTRANIMQQAASLKDYRPTTLLPGIRINTSSTDFAPIESEQLARFDGQGWVRFGGIIGK